jgi:hypothetical protein
MLHWTASIPGKVTTSSIRVGNIRNEFPVGAFCKAELSGPTSQGTAQSAGPQMVIAGQSKLRAGGFLTSYATESVLLGGTVLLGGDGMPP